MSKSLMLLYGRNSVLERLKANPASINKVILQDNFDSPDIEKLIRTNNISVEHLPSRKLARVKPAKDLQGIVAKVDKFSYTPFDDLLSQAQDKQVSLIFLDRINDPHNLGVIIRTAACFGGFAVIIPEFKACEVTEAVLHVASGGENYLCLSKVSNLCNAIIAAKKCGYWIMGAEVSDDAEDINEVKMPFPLGLTLGSEGEGIRYGIQKQLDIRVRIPMQGARLSFNVGMACAVFCHEITRRRGVSK